MTQRFAQSCLTLCDLTDGSPAGSSVHGILQARILEWVALPDPGIEPGSPALQADCLPSDRPDRHKLKHQKSMAISPGAVCGGVPWWFTCSAPAHLGALCLWGATSVCRGLQVVSTATGQSLSYLLKSAFFKGLNIKKEVSSCFNTEKETCFKPGL